MRQPLSRIRQSYYLPEHQTEPYIFLHKLVDGIDNVFVTGYIVEGLGAVFLYPESSQHKIFGVEIDKDLPGQTILCFYRQVRSAPLALRISIGGAEGHFVGGCGAGAINVHFVFEVGHGCGVWQATEITSWEQQRSIMANFEAAVKNS